MGRKIKFRGLHIHALSGNEHLNGTWIYGYLCGNGCYIEPKEGIEKLIDCDTIGQYTGLTDKNGKEIYEGDFLSYKEIVYSDCSREEIEEIRPEAIIEIIFYHEMASIVKIHKGNVRAMCHNPEEHLALIPELDCNELEVIGNVYDNPELLN